MLFITFVAVCLGCLVERARTQRDAASVLRRVNAHIVYDDELVEDIKYGALNHQKIYWQATGRNWGHGGRTHGIAVIDKWLGSDFYRTVIGVDASGSEGLTGADLRVVRDFSRLKILSLDDVGVLRDEDIAHIASLQCLERLFLEGTQISDVGVAKLGRLSRLRYLSLAKTRITDDGLGYLSNLDQLEMLQLSHCRITDAGLLHLRLFKGHPTIYLDGTMVSRKGVADLRSALPLCKVVLVSPNEYWLSE